MAEESQVKAGTAVIVIRDRKVLVGKRKGSHGEGVYAFPGGHLDFSDPSMKLSGEREVFEETGIVCNVFNPDHYREELFTTFDILSTDGQKVYITAYLVADYLHGGKQIQDGGKEMVEPQEDKCEMWYWVTLDELVQLVQGDTAKTWIPINQVLYYLKQLWK
tara:strand:- start:2461 stop:2946 length:486 start_codon:yes stop_codon:yes gene_type:complete